MRTIRTVVDSERLRILLQSGQNGGGSNPLVAKWWNLANTEGALEDEIDEVAYARLNVSVVGTILKHCFFQIHCNAGRLDCFVDCVRLNRIFLGELSEGPVAELV